MSASLTTRGVNPARLYTLRPELADAVAVTRQRSRQRGRRRRVDQDTSKRYRWRGVRYPDTATVPKRRVERYRQHVW